MIAPEQFVYLWVAFIAIEGFLQIIYGATRQPRPDTYGIESVFRGCIYLGVVLVVILL